MDERIWLSVTRNLICTVRFLPSILDINKSYIDLFSFDLRYIYS